MYMEKNYTKYQTFSFLRDFAHDSAAMVKYIYNSKFVLKKYKGINIFL